MTCVVVNIGILIEYFNASPNSLMVSTTIPKVKTMEGKGVRVCSLACSILREDNGKELGCVP